MSARTAGWSAWGLWALTVLAVAPTLLLASLNEPSSARNSAVVPYADLDRGVIDGRPEGSCKLVVSRSSRLILGAHIVGEQAVEVFQLAAAAMRAGMSVEQLADLELAYPTFTAIVGLAARRIVRDLDPDSPHQRASGRSAAAEWEHSELG
jgi:hypothetical protein